MNKTKKPVYRDAPFSLLIKFSQIKNIYTSRKNILVKIHLEWKTNFYCRRFGFNNLSQDSLLSQWDNLQFLFHTWQRHDIWLELSIFCVKLKLSIVIALSSSFVWCQADFFSAVINQMKGIRNSKTIRLSIWLALIRSLTLIPNKVNREPLNTRSFTVN